MHDPLIHVNAQTGAEDQKPVHLHTCRHNHLGCNTQCEVLHDPEQNSDGIWNVQLTAQPGDVQRSLYPQQGSSCPPQLLRPGEGDGRGRARQQCCGQGGAQPGLQPAAALRAAGLCLPPRLARATLSFCSFLGRCPAVSLQACHMQPDLP